MELPPEIRELWTAFLAETSRAPSTPLYDVFSFDDNESDANALLELVRRGRKRATASLLWRFEAEGSPPPRPGDLSVVTDWAGSPRCVIETTRVVVRAFDDVDAEFAAAEGEGDRSLRYWRDVHWTYFGRVCEGLGRERTPRMPVLCEWFEVVFESAVRGAGGASAPTSGRPRGGLHDERPVITARPFAPDESALLKRTRLAALADRPDAFSSKLEIEAGYPDEHWEALARGAGRFEGSRSFLAEIDGEAVGMAGCYPETRERYRLVAMWVHPRARRAGVGAALVAAVEEWARGRGASELVAAVFARNAGAIAFYSGQGFEIRGEAPEAGADGGSTEAQLGKRLSP